MKRLPVVAHLPAEELGRRYRTCPDPKEKTRWQLIWLLLRPGQPLSYVSLSHGLRDLGIPLRLARVAAIRQLALQAPAPVIAEALGFHHTTTHRQTIHACGIWNRYAAPRADPRIHGK